VSAEQADRAAEALIETWEALLVVHPEAWVETNDGAMACATGIPSPGLNGVWCSRCDPDPANLRRLLRELRSRGLPHMFQLRPGSDPEAVAVAAEEELTPSDDMPLMRLDDPSALERAHAAAPDLDIRLLTPEDGDLHALTAAAGFGEKPEHFVRLLPPPVMSANGVRAYVGEVDGQVVTTALGVTREDYVAVFNVGTPAEHRRRGYGASITARVVDDGLAAGASWAWLQSSTSGYRVYEALGFETLERWSCWVRL
jgi:ribosomal protein S18 acetylase RimI-like enzyme